MASFTKRGNVWQYEISTKDPLTEKYKKIRKSGFKTKREAQIAASDVELKLSTGFKFGANNVLLSDYFKSYIEIYKKDKIAYRTYLKYENSLQNIKKYFKNDTLKNLNKLKYQSRLNEYAKTHADRSVRQFNTHIRAVVQNALDEQIIASDFTKNSVTKGYGISKKEEEKFLNFEDFSNLMAESSKSTEFNDSTHVMFYIGGMTGMRFGELAGLSWSQVDLKKQIIDINQEYNYVTKDFGLPKTNESIRKIVIDDETTKILKELKVNQFNSKINNPNDLVFLTYQGKIISNNGANKSLVRMQKRLGISPTITMHGLRHTHGSVLLMKGINILSVSKRLGHANTEITLGVYAHLLKELEEQENDKIKSELSTIKK